MMGKNESSIDLPGILGGHDILILGEAHIDPALAYLLIDQLPALQRSGVKHLVLEMGLSRIATALNLGYSINRAHQWPGDELRNSGHFLHLAVAASSLGIRIHSGDTQRKNKIPPPTIAGMLSTLGLENSSQGRSDEIMDDLTSPQAITICNTEMGNLAARLAASDTGKVLVVAGTAHVAKCWLEIPTIGEIIKHQHASTVSAIATGGLNVVPAWALGPAAPTANSQDKVAVPLAGFANLDFALHFPENTAPAELRELSHLGQNYAFASLLADAELGENNPLAHYLLGNLLCQTWPLPVDEARAHFEKGVAAGDDSQLLRCALLSALSGDITQAKRDARKAQQRGVEGATMLHSAYASQERLQSTVDFA